MLSLLKQAKKLPIFYAWEDFFDIFRDECVLK